MARGVFCRDDWTLDATLMLMKEQIALRALEVEAQMNEAQAKKFRELAALMSDSDHKRKIEALATEATEKAFQLRHQAKLWQDHKRYG